MRGNAAGRRAGWRVWLARARLRGLSAVIAGRVAEGNPVLRPHLCRRIRCIANRRTGAFRFSWLGWCRLRCGRGWWPNLVVHSLDSSPLLRLEIPTSGNEIWSHTPMHITSTGRPGGTARDGRGFVGQALCLQVWQVILTKICIRLSILLGGCAPRPRCGEPSLCLGFEHRSKHCFKPCFLKHRTPA